MGKFERVRYLRVNRLSLEIVSSLGAAEKALYLDHMLTWFLQLERGEKLIQAETDNPVLALALREELGELETGFEKYMHNVNARKADNEQQETSDTPATDQSSITDAPAIDQRSITDASLICPSRFRSIRSILTQTEIDQIKRGLLVSGYSDAEIDVALDRMTDQEIKNPVGYLRKTMENEREKSRKQPPAKTVLAQQYAQRDYSGAQDEATQRMVDSYEAGEPV